MNWKYLYDCEKPRQRVYCLSTELVDGGDGSFTFSDTSMNAKLGDGSEIIVMDQPGTLLFWDATNQKGYNWGATE